MTNLTMDEHAELFLMRTVGLCAAMHLEADVFPEPDHIEKMRDPETLTMRDIGEMQTYTNMLVSFTLRDRVEKDAQDADTSPERVFICPEDKEHEWATEEWQPIETAPNGYDILLWSSEGKIQIADFGNYRKYNQPKFTHWMPLPEPPKAKGEA